MMVSFVHLRKESSKWQHGTERVTFRTKIVIQQFGAMLRELQRLWKRVNKLHIL